MDTRAAEWRGRGAKRGPADALSGGTDSDHQREENAAKGRAPAHPPGAGRVSPRSVVRAAHRAGGPRRAGARAQRSRPTTEEPNPDGCFQQPDELLGSHGPAEVVALSLAAVLGLQKRELLPRFHAFRDDAMPEALAHADHGADDRACRPDRR